jgi:hypothetical protein
MTTKLAATITAAAFSAFASLGHAAESVTSRSIDDVSNVQGRAAPTVVPGKSISLRTISDVSNVDGRSSRIGRTGMAHISAARDLARFGRA